MIDSYDDALKVVLDTMDTAQKINPEVTREQAFETTRDIMRDQAVNARLGPVRRLAGLGN